MGSHSQETFSSPGGPSSTSKRYIGYVRQLFNDSLSLHKVCELPCCRSICGRGFFFFISSLECFNHTKKSLTLYHGKRPYSFRYACCPVRCPNGTHVSRTVTSVLNGTDFFDEPLQPFLLAVALYIINSTFDLTMLWSELLDTSCLHFSLCLHFVACIINFTNNLIS